MRDGAEIPTSDLDIAALASLLADQSRCKVLLALDDGRALPASVLAEEAGVSKPTASSHLGKLTDAAGRLPSRPMAGTTTTVWRVPRSANCSSTWAVSRRRVRSRSLRDGTRAARLRSARTCYDHVAGKLGVQVMDSLLAREVLVGGDGRYDPDRDSHDALSSPGHDIRYELTETGRDFLTDVGIELPTGKRPLVRYCVDWTEQRHHLSGALGRAVFDRFLSAGWVKRARRGRGLDSQRRRARRTCRPIRYQLGRLITLPRR